MLANDGAEAHFCVRFQDRGMTSPVAVALQLRRSARITQLPGQSGPRVALPSLGALVIFGHGTNPAEKPQLTGAMQHYGRHAQN
jgi:hypothetical protein